MDGECLISIATIWNSFILHKKSPVYLANWFSFTYALDVWIWKKRSRSSKEIVRKTDSIPGQGFVNGLIPSSFYPLQILLPRLLYVHNRIRQYYIVKQLCNLIGKAILLVDFFRLDGRENPTNNIRHFLIFAKAVKN